MNQCGALVSRLLLIDVHHGQIEMNASFFLVDQFQFFLKEGVINGARLPNLSSGHTNHNVIPIFQHVIVTSNVTHGLE